MIAVQQPPERDIRLRIFPRAVGVVWGIGGIGGVLLYATVRLSHYALDALMIGLNFLEASVMVFGLIFMAWVEGYRGFQQRFSPRAAARALYLFQHPTAWDLWLAPFFCAGLFGGTSRLQRRTWAGVGLIGVAVLLFDRLPHPWRGIFDGGVALGLSWGIVSLALATWTTFRHRQPLVPAEVSPHTGV